MPTDEDGFVGALPISSASLNTPVLTAIQTSMSSLFGVSRKRGSSFLPDNSTVGKINLAPASSMPARSTSGKNSSFPRVGLRPDRPASWRDLCAPRENETAPHTAFRAVRVQLHPREVTLAPSMHDRSCFTLARTTSHLDVCTQSHPGISSHETGLHVCDRP